MDKHGHINYVSEKIDGLREPILLHGNWLQIVNFALHWRHINMLDEYLEHTTRELPTEDV
jgi:hypothetical protein